MAEFVMWKGDTNLFHWDAYDSTGSVMNLTSWAGTFQAKSSWGASAYLFQATNCTVGGTAGTVEIRLGSNLTSTVGSTGTISYDGLPGTTFYYQVIVGTYAGGTLVVREHVLDYGTLHIRWRTMP